MNTETMYEHIIYILSFTFWEKQRTELIWIFWYYFLNIIEFLSILHFLKFLKKLVQNPK